MPPGPRRSSLVIEKSVPRAQDDLFLRAAELHPVQVDYLSWQPNDDLVSKTWRFATLSKDNAFQGRRKENAIWRTWFQNQFNLAKLNPEVLGWDKNGDILTLWGPLVLADSGCSTKAALTSGIHINNNRNKSGNSHSSSSPSPRRSALRLPSLTTLVKASQSSKSSTRSDSNSSGSSRAPNSASSSGRRVSFDSFVHRARIRDEAVVELGVGSLESVVEYGLAESADIIRWIDHLPPQSLDGVAVEIEDDELGPQEGPNIPMPIPITITTPEGESEGPRRGRSLTRSRSFENVPAASRNTRQTVSSFTFSTSPETYEEAPIRARGRDGRRSNAVKPLHLQPNPSPRTSNFSEDQAGRAPRRRRRAAFSLGS